MKSLYISHPSKVTILHKQLSEEIVINKTIYILWLQGFDNAPEIVKICLISWIEKNPSWNIVLLDETSLTNYINIEHICKSKTISKASLSDIIRITLLKQYGGLWVDATTYCTKPLDHWLTDYTATGFFAFNFEKDNNSLPDRLISSWFLYAEKGNYIIDCWHKQSMQYCQDTSIIGHNDAISTKEKWLNNNHEAHYFWFHYIFEDLYKANTQFKEIWDNSLKLSEKGPHFIQRSGMLYQLTDNVKNHIDLKKAPLYKLTYRFDEVKYNHASNLYYLLHPKYTTMNIAANNYKVKDCIPNIHFIHIGKCGGTALIIFFKDQEIKLNDFHLQKPTPPEAKDKYIIWVRNPLHRFVSAFNYSLALINTSTVDLNENTLTIYNCLAPGIIRSKMQHNYTFSTEYDDLINFFLTPNNLAEALTSQDTEIRNKAIKLMNHPMEHINKGIGWYLDNGEFIKEHREKILFVGKTETMKTDISNLSKLLGIHTKVSNKKIRENTSYTKYLSSLAIENLLNFYKDTDYKALQALHEEGWIDKNMYQSYFMY